MTPKTRDWFVAIAYVILIYATLEVARIPMAFLRAHGWLRISLAIIFSIAAFSVVNLMIRQKINSPWKYAALVAIGIIYFFMMRTVQMPEEQIHFLEYGLVGIFFLRALRHQVQNSWKLWVGAFLLASLAGWIDELLQGISPHRHYDIRDVRLNAISAGLGLLLARIVQPSKSPR